MKRRELAAYKHLVGVTTGQKPDYHLLSTNRVPTEHLFSGYK